MAEETKAIAGFGLEYVSSDVSVLSGDGIVVHVVNDSSFSGAARAVLFQNTGAGAVTVADSGIATLTPSWSWSFAFTVSHPGEYWVRIQTSSEELIPQASFERLDGAVWKPVIVYKTGDFAVYSLSRKRLW